MGLLESSEKMVAIPYCSFFNFTFSSRCLCFSFELGTRALSSILEMNSNDLNDNCLSKKLSFSFLPEREKNG